MTKAHQLDPAGCTKTFTFDQFQTLSDKDLAGLYADEKFDGRRYLLQVRPNGAKFNYLTSRRKSVVTNLMVEKQDSLPFFRDCAFGPRDSVYDGELVHPDGGTSHEAATAIAEGTALFRVFDVLRLDGKDLRSSPQSARWWALSQVARDFPDRIYAVPHSKSPRRLLHAVRETGGEGIILKVPTAEYGEGWFKVVSVEFHDVVVIGYEMSDSDKYGPKHWIKGVRFGQWVPINVGEKHFPTTLKSFRSKDGQCWGLIEMGQTSGFTEKLRAEISANKEKFLGRVMIIKAKGREVSGAFRHPRFHDWHPDKNEKECIFREYNRAVS